MSYLTETMMAHLKNKGIRSEIIPGFMRDLANSIFLNPSISLKELNVKLHSLGWDDFEMDDYTLQLVLAAIEAEESPKQHAFQLQRFGFVGEESSSGKPPR